MRLNKKKIVCIILLMCFLINMINTNIVNANETDVIEFNDENFKKALIDIGVDKNGDGEISKDEANKVTSIFIVENKNIRDISEIEYFSNLEKLSLQDNEIEDISVLESLEKLNRVNLMGNKLNCSPLRSYDENTIKIIERLREKGIIFIGEEAQTLDYDEKQITNQPEHKVLFVYAKDIDVVTEKDGEMVNYKNTLTEDDMEYFDVCQEMFEKTVEKISDYSVNIVRDTYVTKNVITDVSVGTYDGGKKDYTIMPKNIPEIESKLNKYDTIFVCTMYNNDLINCGSSGLTSWEYYNYCYHGEIMCHFLPSDKEDIETIRQGKDTYIIDTMIHEFCHSLEGYGNSLKFPMWEYHNAREYYYTEYQFTDYFVSSEYIKGVSNPNGDGTVGIIEHLWELAPSENAGKLIAINETELNLKIGENKALYCNVRNPNYDKELSRMWTTNVEWSSTNPEIASVDENGLILAKKSGTCDIVAENKEFGQSIKCIVNVVGDNTTQKEIESIEIKEVPNKIRYFIGESLELNGLVITVNYSDKSSEDIVEGFSCDTKTLDEIGNKIITISYEGKNTTFNVFVESKIKEIESISVKRTPNRLNYFKGDTLDLYGLIINVKYSDGTLEEKTFGYTSDKTELNEIGKQNIPVFYEGKSTTLNVNVYDIKEAEKYWTDMSNLKYEIVNIGSKEEPNYSLRIYNFEKKENHNYYVWIARSEDKFIEENKSINKLTAEQVNSISFIKFENLSANINDWINGANDLSFQIIEEYEVAPGLTALKVVYGKNKLNQSTENNIKVEYNILEGAKQEIDGKSNLIIKADGDINKFVGLNIDGKELNKDNYIVKSGSTIATVKKEYLETLKNGEHTITFVFEDGEVFTSFYIAKVDDKTNVENDEKTNEIENETNLNNTKDTNVSPQTGDSVGIYIIIAIIALIVLILIIRYNNNNMKK